MGRYLVHNTRRDNPERDSGRTLLRRQQALDPTVSLVFYGGQKGPARADAPAMSHKRELKLGAFLPAAGHHVAAWRHPSAQADAGINIQHYIRLAKTAERAKLDAI